MHRDNEVTLHSAHNPVLRKRSKHIEVDSHFIWEKIMAGVIKPSYILTKF